MTNKTNFIDSSRTEIISIDGIEYLRIAFHEDYKPKIETGNGDEFPDIFIQAPKLSDYNEARRLSLYLNQITLDYIKNGYVQGLIESFQTQFIAALRRSGYVDALKNMESRDKYREFEVLCEEAQMRIFDEISLNLSFAKFDYDELSKMAESELNNFLTRAFVETIYQESQAEEKDKITAIFLKFILSSAKFYINKFFIPYVAQYEKEGDVEYLIAFKHVIDRSFSDYSYLIEEIVITYISFFLKFFPSRTLQQLVSHRISTTVSQLVSQESLEQLTLEQVKELEGQ